MRQNTVFGPQSHIIQTHSPGTRRPCVWTGIRFLAPCAFPLSPRDILSYWLTSNRRLFYVLSSRCVSPIFIRCCLTPRLPCCTGFTFYAFRRWPVALGFLVCRCNCLVTVILANLCDLCLWMLGLLADVPVHLLYQLIGLWIVTQFIGSIMPTAPNLCVTLDHAVVTCH